MLNVRQGIFDTVILLLIFNHEILVIDGNRLLRMARMIQLNADGQQNVILQHGDGCIVSVVVGRGYGSVITKSFKQAHVDELYFFTSLIEYSICKRYEL